MDTNTLRGPSTTRLLKANEVQEILGVSRSWLYEAATHGRIPSIRLGAPDGPLRFPLGDLERWIAGHRAPAQVESPA